MKISMIKWAVAPLFLIALAACGGGESAPEPAVETAPIDDPVVEEPVAVEDDAVDEEEAAQVVVEESAAEAETDEQPILLAEAQTTTAAQEWQFTEGQHYTRMVPSQPTMGGADKIEVSEFFWYGCPHCYTFEPTINQWAANIPANVRFVRIPVVWNRVHEVHARAYFSLEVLGRNGALDDAEALHEDIFNEVQNRGNRLTSEDSIRRVFERHGVAAADFDKTWSSFEVDQKMRVAQDLGRRYSIQSVPAIVVNGKYRTGGQEAGGYDNVPAVIDELITRETVR